MKDGNDSQTAIKWVVFLSFMGLWAGGASATEFSALEKQLARIRFSERGKDVNLPTFEARCLELLVDHNSPSEKGKIYATMTLMYAEKGFISAQDPRVAKTIRYARKSLEQPLDVLAGCEMYSRWAGGLIAQSRNYSESHFSEQRSKTIQVCLKGLKLALDNGAPAERPQPPEPVFRLHMSMDTEGYEPLKAEREQRVQAWEEYELLSDLFLVRWSLERNCVTLYTRRPYNTEEFVQQASKLLGDYDDAVAAVLAEIEKGIAFNRSLLAPPTRN